MAVRGILIEAEDQLVTLVDAAAAGDTVVYERGGEVFELTAKEAVPQYHKIAICDIEKGSTVYKYGQPIGSAATEILKGQWVHTHNLISECFA